MMSNYERGTESVQGPAQQPGKKPETYEKSQKKSACSQKRQKAFARFEVTGNAEKGFKHYLRYHTPFPVPWIGRQRQGMISDAQQVGSLNLLNMNEQFSFPRER